MLGGLIVPLFFTKGEAKMAHTPAATDPNREKELQRMHDELKKQIADTPQDEDAQVDPEPQKAQSKKA